MGIDVELWARGPADLLTDERIAEATAYMDDRYPWRTFVWPKENGPAPILTRYEFVPEEWGDVAVIEAGTSGARYYSAGYERGPWPQIYGAIRVLQAAFPECEIFYHGDGSMIDDGIGLVTEERLAELWAHFLGPEGDAYRRERS